MNQTEKTLSEIQVYQVEIEIKTGAAALQQPLKPCPMNSKPFIAVKPGNAFDQTNGSRCDLVRTDTGR